MKKYRFPVVLFFLVMALLLQTCTSTEQSTAKNEYATVELSNRTPYKIIGVYIADSSGRQSENLLLEHVVAPHESYNVNVSKDSTTVRVDFLVGNVICSMSEKHSFTAGKSYSWKVSETTWPFVRSVDYEYADDSYEYYEDSYGYYEDEYY